jgi:hypothetical protein
MHHEAMLLLKAHPSVALVCFTSTVETLAQMDARLKELGSRKRFDSVVQSVLPPQEASQLTDAYKRRSKTVHESLLHGTELEMGGMGFISTFVADPTFDFTFRLVLTAKEASRRLLLRELGVSNSDV